MTTGNTKFCFYCGQKIAFESTYCEYCGKQLKSNSSDEINFDDSINEQLEAEKKAKAEAEKRAKAKAEAEKRAKAKAEAEKRAKAKAEAEFEAKLKAEFEAEKKAKAKAEAEKKAKTDKDLEILKNLRQARNKDKNQKDQNKKPKSTKFFSKRKIFFFASSGILGLAITIGLIIINLQSSSNKIFTTTYSSSLSTTEAMGGYKLNDMINAKNPSSQYFIKWETDELRLFAKTHFIPGVINKHYLYSKAIAKRAYDGEPKANFYIGAMYFNGEGFEQNLPMAVDFFLRSTNITESQYYLARTYYELFKTGQIASISSTTSGNEDAIRKSILAVRQSLIKSPDYPEAQFFFAFLMDKDFNDEYSKEESDLTAYKYYLKSAENNYLEAQLTMGAIYESGWFGQEVNLSKSKFWYLQAKNYDSRAVEALDRVNLAITAEAERKAKAEAERKAKEEAERKARIAEAERKAKEEAERKARIAEAERKARIAEAERKAKAETERKAKAEAERKAKAEADRKAKIAEAAKFDPPANRLSSWSLYNLIRVGNDYYNAGDYILAYPYFYAAAYPYYLNYSFGHNDARAQNHVGYMYSKGLGVMENDYAAVKWYKLSANQGNKYGQFALGNSHRIGDGGLTQNNYEAVRLYILSANQGYAGAQNNLGVRYEAGDGGLLQSYAEARYWYQLAANQGNDVARKNLERIRYK
ncbi:MAG: hypothetical protein ACJZ9C_02280 [Dehalococcoidia bacterium]